MKNIYKFFGSSLISMIGSEAMTLGSAIYVMKITGDFWLTTLLYLCMQIPALLTYSLAGIISKKIKLKNILIISDLSSIISLVILLILFFVITNKTYFSYSLLALNIVNSIIHSFRFPAYRGSIKEITKNDEEIKKTNILISKGTIISLMLGPLLTAVFTFFTLPFYVFIIIDSITYLGSILLVISIKYIKKDSIKKPEKIVANKYSKKFYSLVNISIISYAIILAFLTFTRQEHMFQTLNFLNLDYASWSTFIVMSGALGSFIGAFSFKYIENKIKYSNLILFYVFGMVFLGILFYYVKGIASIWVFLVFNALFSILFSYSITKYYNSLYTEMHIDNLPKYIGLSMIVRIVFITIISLLFTYLYLTFGWMWSTYLMLGLFFITIIVCIYSENKFQKINKLSSKNNY